MKYEIEMSGIDQSWSALTWDGDQIQLRLRGGEEVSEFAEPWDATMLTRGFADLDEAMQQPSQERRDVCEDEASITWTLRRSGSPAITMSVEDGTIPANVYIPWDTVVQAACDAFDRAEIQGLV